MSVYYICPPRRLPQLTALPLSGSHVHEEENVIQTVQTTDIFVIIIGGVRIGHNCQK